MTKFSGLCKIHAVKPLSEKIYSISIDCPQIASKCGPGQFIQLKLLDYPSLIWPRPFSIHKASDGIITLSVKKYGKITSLLETKMPGKELFVTGPLGNQFPMPPDGKDLYFAAGGVGLPPLHYFCSELIKAGYPKKNLHFYSGARSVDELFGNDELEKLGIDYVVATDDGSFGIKGYITEPLTVELMKRRTGGDKFDPIVYGCGPVPMLKRMSELCYGLTCYLSLEQLMPCGWGVCNGCAVKLKLSEKTLTEDNRDFKLARVCKDGPIFDASEVLWE